MVRFEKEFDYIKIKLAGATSSEIPIFEILLTIDKKLNVKLGSTYITKRTNHW